MISSGGSSNKRGLEKSERKKVRVKRPKHKKDADEEMAAEYRRYLPKQADFMPLTWEDWTAANPMVR